MAAGFSDESINVALTATFGDLQAGMVRGAEIVKENTDAIKQQMDQLREDFALLDAVTAKNVRSLEDVARAESMLDRMQQQNMISTAELAKAFRTLDDAEARLTREAAKASAGLAAQGETTAALGAINAGVAREIGVLGNEVVNGNFHRMEGSLIVMANRANLLQYAFSPLGLAIMGTAATMGVLAKAMNDEIEREQGLNRLLIETGGALGVTTDGFDEMAHEIAGSNRSIKSAEDALKLVGETGRFSGEQLKQAGQTAMDMSVVTGRSMDDCVRAITKLRDDPVKAIKELDQQYHFLSTTQLQEIEKLEEQGRSFDAAALAMGIYSKAMAERAAEVEKNLSFLDSLLNQVKNDAHSMWEALGQALDKSLLGVESQANKLRDAREEYIKFKVALEHREQGTEGPIEAMLFSNYSRDQLRAKMEEARTRFYRLADEAQAADKAAKDQAQKTATQSAGNEGATFLDKQDEQLDKKVAKQREYQRVLDQTVTALKAVKAAGGDTHGIEFDAKGDPSGAAWEKRKAQIAQETGLTRQLTTEHNKAEAAARAEERAREKAGHEAINKLEQVRDQQERGTQAELDSDKKIVEAARKAFGDKSSEYTNALKRMKSDQDAFDKEKLKGDLDDLETQHKIDQQGIAQKRNQALDDVNNKKITAAEYKAAEQQLIADLLAIDTKYYTTKAQLESKDVNAAKADLNQIKVANAQAQVDMQKADTDYHRRLQQQWAQTAQKISQSMSGAFNSMIFQGTSFKSAITGLGVSLAQTWVNDTVDTMVKGWGVGETTKTEATVAGNAARDASNIQSGTVAMAVTAKTSLQAIMAKGAEVIANVWNSVAAIPYVGPFLAPAMAVAAGAAVYSLANRIPSASGGWGQVPADTLAQIHKDEMVLPADLAKGVRKMSQMGGSGGGGDNYYISGMDARSIKESLRRNPSSLAKGIRQAQLRNHLPETR